MLYLIKVDTIPKYLFQCFSHKRVISNEHQWRSQNAEKIKNIKGRLLNEEMILFICIPFQNGNLEGANYFLYEQFLIVMKITFII